MKNLIYIVAGLALTSLATSCKPTLDEPKPSAGDLSFSRYVAAGDYNTAGFMAGGISRESQLTSYPALLAQQFALARKAVPFAQPFLPIIGTQMVTIRLRAAEVPVLGNTTGMNSFLQAGCNT